MKKKISNRQQIAKILKEFEKENSVAEISWENRVSQLFKSGASTMAA